MSTILTYRLTWAEPDPNTPDQTCMSPRVERGVSCVVEPESLDSIPYRDYCHASYNALCLLI